jgi:Fe-S cluster assembly ATP-binding protein
MDMNKLVISGLRVTVEAKEILKGLSLSVPSGEVHAIMGPNGSGKSTLASTLMGHPKYTVTSGSVMYADHDVLALPANERAKLGLFLSFQYPMEIAGVSLGNFLRTAYNAHRETPIDVGQFYDLLQAKAKQMGMNEDFITRGVNENFSGGEKKRAEILQMMVLQPTMCILDETDSGLDIDALKVVADGVNSLRSPDRGFLVITHYQRLLNYIKPDVVHVLIDGKIVKTGGPELAQELEQTGYESVSA